MFRTVFCTIFLTACRSEQTLDAIHRLLDATDDNEARFKRKTVVQFLVVHEELGKLEHTDSHEELTDRLRELESVN